MPSLSSKRRSVTAKPRRQTPANKARRVILPELPTLPADSSSEQPPPIFERIPELFLCKPGDVVTLCYPADSDHGRPIQLENRTVRVLELQDATIEPLSIDAFLRRPNLRRGRWRLWAWEPKAFGKRAFYLDWHSPARLQLGKCDPLTGRCEERIDEPFEQSEDGIALLIATCRELLKRPLPPDNRATLAIYAVDENAGGPAHPYAPRGEANAESDLASSQTFRRLNLHDFISTDPDFRPVIEKGELVEFEQPPKLIAGRRLSQSGERGTCTEAGMVIEVEDMSEQPYMLTSIHDWPADDRGRWRLRYFDFSSRRVRTANLDALRLPKLQFGLWDLIDRRRVKLVGEAFEQSNEGKLALLGAVEHVLRNQPRRFDSSTLAVFAVNDDGQVTNSPPADEQASPAS